MNQVLGIIQVIGTFIAVGTLMILGIKYMVGSAEERASYKKSMLPYIIGSVLIFSAVNITSVVYDVVYQTTISDEQREIDRQSELSKAYDDGYNSGYNSGLKIKSKAQYDRSWKLAYDAWKKEYDEDPNSTNTKYRQGYMDGLRNGYAKAGGIVEVPLV